MSAAAESCNLAHPDSQFTWITFGALPDWCRDVIPASVRMLRAEEIVRNFDRHAFAYDVFELGTVIKPACFLHLLAESDEDLVFIDPDVWVRSRLRSVEDSFATGDVILTPHLLAPSEDATLSFRDACRYGAYNLGFLGLRATPDVGECMQWWERCVLDTCTRAVESGVYLDQRWADLMPSLFSNVAILRDPGVNVGWWNGLTRDWGGASLIHFSGFDAARPDLVTRYRPDLRVSHLSGAASDAFREYRHSLERYSLPRWRNEPYSYGHLSDGTPIPYMLRVLFRTCASVPEGQVFSADSQFLKWALQGTGEQPPPLLRAVRELLPEAPRDGSFGGWLRSQIVDPGLAAPRFAALATEVALSAGSSAAVLHAPLELPPVWDRCECGRPRPDGQVARRQGVPARPVTPAR